MSHEEVGWLTSVMELVGGRGDTYPDSWVPESTLVCLIISRIFTEEMCVGTNDNSFWWPPTRSLFHWVEDVLSFTFINLPILFFEYNVLKTHWFVLPFRWSPAVKELLSIEHRALICFKLFFKTIFWESARIIYSKKKFLWEPWQNELVLLETDLVLCWINCVVFMFQVHGILHLCLGRSQWGWGEWGCQAARDLKCPNASHLGP